MSEIEWIEFGELMHYCKYNIVNKGCPFLIYREISDYYKFVRLKNICIYKAEHMLNSCKKCQLQSHRNDRYKGAYRELSKSLE